MSKKINAVATASALLAFAGGPAAEEAVAALAYEYAGEWDRCGPAPAEGEERATFHRLCEIAVTRG